LPNPVSLKVITGKSFVRRQILTNIIKKSKKQYSLQDFDTVRAGYFDNLYRKNDFSTYQSGKEIFQTKIIAVENDGKLILLTKSGEKREFYFKEVKLVK